MSMIRRLDFICYKQLLYSQGASGVNIKKSIFFVFEFYICDQRGY